MKLIALLVCLVPLVAARGIVPRDSVDSVPDGSLAADGFEFQNIESFLQNAAEKILQSLNEDIDFIPDGSNKDDSEDVLVQVDEADSIPDDPKQNDHIDEQLAADDLDLIPDGSSKADSDDIVVEVGLFVESLVNDDIDLMRDTSIKAYESEEEQLSEDSLAKTDSEDEISVKNIDLIPDGSEVADSFDITNDNLEHLPDLSAPTDSDDKILIDVADASENKDLTPDCSDAKDAEEQTEDKDTLEINPDGSNVEDALDIAADTSALTPDCSDAKDAEEQTEDKDTLEINPDGSNVEDALDITADTSVLTPDCSDAKDAEEQSEDKDTLEITPDVENAVDIIPDCSDAKDAEEVSELIPNIDADIINPDGSAKSESDDISEAVEIPDGSKASDSEDASPKSYIHTAKSLFASLVLN